MNTAEQRDIRIYRNPRPWWDYPYTVIDGTWPTGPVISVAHTFRGALRIARRKAKQPAPNNDYIQVWPQETT